MNSNNSKGKTIALIPSDANHHDFYGILAESLRDFNCYVCILAKADLVEMLRQDLGEEGVQYCSRPEGENLLRSIVRHRACLTSATSVLFDEPYESLKYLWLPFLAMRRTKKFLIIHNVNRWFLPAKRLSAKSLFIKYVKTCILRRVSGVAVVSPQMKTCLTETYGLSVPVYSVPFSIPAEVLSSSEPDAGRLRVAVPGMVDWNRRNYELLADALENINAPAGKYLDIRLVGYVVDKPRNWAAVARFDAINRRRGAVQVHYWRDRLPPENFAEEIRAADILLANLNLDYQDVNTVERYGVTKASGTTYLILKYAKPAIVPRDFNVRKELSGQYLQYSNADDLAVVFNALLRGTGDLTALQTKSRENSQRYIDVAHDELAVFTRSLAQ